MPVSSPPHILPCESSDLSETVHISRVKSRKCFEHIKHHEIYSPKNGGVYELEYMPLLGSHRETLIAHKIIHENFW